MSEHLSEPEQALGEFIINLAREGNGLEIHVDDDVEVNWDNWTVEEVDSGVEDGDGYFEVQFTQDSYRSERVSRASRHHPPEYENYDVELVGVIRLFPSRSYLGECEGEIIQEGGVPEPPAPEPYDDRL